jgi:hypothetical protein
MEQGPRRVCRGDVGCVGYAVESLCVVTVPCLNWIKKKKKKKKKKISVVDKALYMTEL